MTPDSWQYIIFTIHLFRQWSSNSCNSLFAPRLSKLTIGHEHFGGLTQTGCFPHMEPRGSGVVHGCRALIPKLLTSANANDLRGHNLPTIYSKVFICREWKWNFYCGEINNLIRNFRRPGLWRGGIQQRPGGWCRKIPGIEMELSRRHTRPSRASLHPRGAAGESPTLSFQNIYWRRPPTGYVPSQNRTSPVQVP